MSGNQFGKTKKMLSLILCLHVVWRSWVKSQPLSRGRTCTSNNHTRLIRHNEVNIILIQICLLFQLHSAGNDLLIRANRWVSVLYGASGSMPVGKTSGHEQTCSSTPVTKPPAWRAMCHFVAGVVIAQQKLWWLCYCCNVPVGQDKDTLPW